MYLFNRKGNRIDIYTLVPDEDKLKIYREEEMAKVPYQDMLYRASTNGPVVLGTKDVYSINELDFKHNGIYHEFLKDHDRPMREVVLLINNYINGFYKDCPVAKIVDENGKVLNYVLLPFEYMRQYYPLFNMLYLDNVLSIPKSLYLLQLLELERFDALKGENIDEQLSMFSLSKGPIDHIFCNPDIDEDCFGLEDMKLVEASQLILKRKKKM